MTIVMMGDRLKTFVNFVSVVFCANLIVGGYMFSIVLSLYIFLLSSYAWLLLLYMTWIIFVDTTVWMEGGRRVRNFLNPILSHAVDYFCYQLVFNQNWQPDDNRNYLVCTFPHGIYPIATVMACNVDTHGFQHGFPNHHLHIATLNMAFYFPFHRELLLALGLVSVSEKSMSYVLRKPTGGNFLLIFPGGAEECFHAKEFRFVAKNRKGFVRVALKNGASLVPLITFGENQIYGFTENAVVVQVLRCLKKLLGISLTLPMGRWYTLIPKKVKITALVGEPLDLPKIENPSREQIDEYHSKFIEKLKELFETNKHKYLEEADKTTLEII